MDGSLAICRDLPGKHKGGHIGPQREAARGIVGLAGPCFAGSSSSFRLRHRLHPQGDFAQRRDGDSFSLSEHSSHWHRHHHQQSGHAAGMVPLQVVRAGSILNDELLLAAKLTSSRSRRCERRRRSHVDGGCPPQRDECAGSLRVDMCTCALARERGHGPGICGGRSTSGNELALVADVQQSLRTVTRRGRRLDAKCRDARAGDVTEIDTSRSALPEDAQELLALLGSGGRCTSG
mmetsp:Transcript_37541/g.82337  ORF Transcript_37541/g.82337 Transcript_37541/m.82337 type:complete len:235 (+) Transcript_37541:1543-2247(+)